MPRDLPIGNGTVQVNFDASYRIRDLYFPRVGDENHYFLVGVCGSGGCGIDRWATGKKEFQGAEGTWRAAEFRGGRPGDPWHNPAPCPCSVFNGTCARSLRAYSTSSLSAAA